jgi:hypothetical protein
MAWQGAVLCSYAPSLERERAVLGEAGLRVVAREHRHV